MLFMEYARAMVTARGRPSGMATTIKVIDTMTYSRNAIAVALWPSTVAILTISLIDNT